MPRLKSLVLRNEAITIKNTVFRSLIDKVFAYPISDKRMPLNVHGGVNAPQHIEFNNGGRLVFGGLDNSSKWLGGEFDVLWTNELHRIEDSSAISDLLATMAGGRSGNFVVNGERKYLFLADMNPSSPYHWVYQLAEEGKAPWWHALTHQDHPEHYLWQKQEWTKLGKKSRADLLRSYPAGFLRERMVYGKWVAAEGLVYSVFDPKLHVVERTRESFDDTTVWRVSMDFGGANPHSVLLVAQEGDRHTVYKEIYKAGITVGDLIDETQAMLKREGLSLNTLRTCFVDHNSEHGLQLSKAGRSVTLASKEVLAGIESVRNMFMDGKLYLNKHSLVAKDDMQEGPQGVKEEILNYAYKPENKRTGSAQDEIPMKVSDHAMDALRYYCHSLANQIDMSAFENLGSVRMGDSGRGGVYSV